MKVVGTRYIKQQPWFGQVDSSATNKKYDATELEKVMIDWFKEKSNVA